MTRRRWIADEVSGNRAALTGKHADHLTRVLRARLGEEFDIAIGPTVRAGRIVGIEAGRVEFELGDETPTPPAMNISLALSVFKFDRLEWAIEKCTELGVSRIIPLLARRTEAHLAFAAVKRVERWRKLALQASEQSRRTNPPEIDTPQKLKDAVSLVAGLRVVLSETEQEASLRDVIPPVASELILAIGPEGGWAEDELRQFREAGWISASLGQTILRAETAAIAATAIATSVLRP